MDRAAEVKEQFWKDVASHEMEVLHCDGLYRHLRFTKEKSSVYWFDIITWPGKLCYTGDMGTYVFARLPDMFEFFRGKSINADYWAEKVIGVDRDGITEYSEDLFRAKIEEYLSEAGASTDELRRAVEDEVLVHADNEFEARQAANNFKCDGFEFTEFWEYKFKEFTRRYLWGCCAIQWGIEQYDKLGVRNGE